MSDERHPDELEELLAQLRAPAQPGELDGESSIVAAMTSAYHASGVATMTPGKSRRIRVATMIAVGVIGFGGVAAAGPGGFDVLGSDASDDTTALDTTSTSTSTSTTTSTTSSTSTSTTTSTTSTTTSTTMAPATSAETTAPTSAPVDSLVDDPTTEFDETQCADGNHGKTVSSVAQSVPPGPGHGEQVSIAAQSSCGKQGAGDDESSEEESSEDESSDDSGKPENPGNGNGNGNKPDDAGKPENPGNGNGNGNKPDEAGKPENPGNGNGNGNGKP